MSAKKQNIISILIIVIGIIGSLVFFNLKGKDNQEENPVDNFLKKVETMRMGEENSKKAEITKTAVFKTENSADVISEQSGRVVSVNFETGDHVTKGQVLATFDQSSLVNSAKVALEDSQRNFELARDNYKRSKESVEETLEIADNNKEIAELQLEQAEDGGDQDVIDLAEKALENAKDAEDKAEEDTEIAINNSKIQVSQAESTVRQNKIAYEKSIVRAPVSGIITSKNVDFYDYISSGGKVAEISGVSKMKAKVFLSNFEISKIKEDQPVIIDFSGKKYSGKINAFSTLANSNNNRHQVEIESTEDISKEVNRSAEIKIELTLNTESEESFFIPLSAVSIGQQRNTAFVLREGKAELSEIKIGKTIGSQIEILSGLKTGDQLIIENNRNLRDGEEVENVLKKIKK